MPKKPHYPEAIRIEEAGSCSLRPVEVRTESGVVLFLSWLDKYHPELLRKGKSGALHQQLKRGFGGSVLACPWERAK